MKTIKSYGQHFLKNNDVAKAIIDETGSVEDYVHVIEIGPGPGILTQYLYPKFGSKLILVELDKRMIPRLQEHCQEATIINRDFLKVDISEFAKYPCLLIGNFPYNISSQILFKVLDHKNLFTTVIGMFQKEVAVRAIAGPGSKDYGILSVLLKSYYEGSKILDVAPEEFRPPPKVQSAVIRLDRNAETDLPCSASGCW